MLVGRLVIQVLMSCLHDVDCKVFDDKTPVNPSRSVISFVNIHLIMYHQFTNYFVQLYLGKINLGNKKQIKVEFIINFHNFLFKFACNFELTPVSFQFWPSLFHKCSVVMRGLFCLPSKHQYAK